MANIDENKKVMVRKASDNEYLHKDFHLSMNLLMDYIYHRFGKEQLVRYLQQYAEAYYKPLREELKKGNMDALLAYMKGKYEKEKWEVTFFADTGGIKMVQTACPAITHIKKTGGEPCAHYKESYHTIYTTLCEGTPFEYTLEQFDEETGACTQLFRRKEVAK